MIIHKKIIILQAVFIIGILLVLYLLYPKTKAEILGNTIAFDNDNAKFLIISENSDFSNARYIEIKENLSLSLKPGTYYWKTSNGVIESITRKFVIESEIGMKIDSNENESQIVNIGNVVMNVSKNKDGVMIGNIVLEPEEKEKIENADYAGRQYNAEN